MISGMNHPELIKDILKKIEEVKPAFFDFNKKIQYTIEKYRSKLNSPDIKSKEKVEESLNKLFELEKLNYKYLNALQLFKNRYTYNQSPPSEEEIENALTIEQVIKMGVNNLNVKLYNIDFSDYAKLNCLVNATIACNDDKYSQQKEFVGSYIKLKHDMLKYAMHDEEVNDAVVRSSLINFKNTIRRNTDFTTEIKHELLYDKVVLNYLSCCSLTYKDFGTLENRVLANASFIHSLYQSYLTILEKVNERFEDYLKSSPCEDDARLAKKAKNTLVISGNINDAISIFHNDIDEIESEETAKTASIGSFAIK